jgi:hypothetical protein
MNDQLYLSGDITSCGKSSIIRINEARDSLKRKKKTINGKFSKTGSADENK